MRVVWPLARSMTFILWLVVGIPLAHVQCEKNEVSEDQLLGVDNGLSLVPVGMRQAGSFIINGDDASKDSHPYQVTIQVRFGPRWYHICGGAIIGPRTVVTAAHCLFYWGIYRHRVGVGWNNLATGEYSVGATVVYIAYVDIHNDYDRRSVTGPNDIAILALAQSVSESRSIQYVDLPELGENFVGTTCRIAGWGRTSAYSSIPDALQTIEVPVIQQSKCRSYWRIHSDYRIEDSHICTHASQYGTRALKNVCNGDSGGPLVCNRTLAGLVSWGMKGCRGCWPDVCTRVTFFLDWIQERM